jgi:8-oxo-dGTP diphosphatase
MSKEQRTRTSSYGIVVDEYKGILLCRLSPIVGPDAGKWTLPGGGIDYGEEPINGVVREIKEETGLNAKVVKLLDVDSKLLDFETHTVHAIRIIYQVTVDAGDLVVETGGSTDACDWFRKDQLKHLPLNSLSEKALKLIGWNGDKDNRDKYDLSLTGLMQYYEEEGNPRAEMTLDYLQEIRQIHDYHTTRSRWRLNKMRDHR